MKYAKDNFCRHYTIKDNGCWEWNGRKNYKGYGLTSGAEYNKAHRLSWYYSHNKKIEKGMCVCHTCDNPSCVNPEHLFLGTHADNAADRQRKGRSCRGEKSHLSKLTEDQVLAIYQDAHQQHVIAKKYNLTQVAISFIKNGITWKHVTNHSANNSKKHKGISWHKTKQKWVAYIHVNTKYKYLGAYKTKIAASYARHNAEVNYL